MKGRGRILFIFFMLMVWAVGLVTVFFFIQIHRAAFYRGLAYHQYTFEQVSDGLRGEIVDRYGTVLAGNRDVLSAFITPRALKDKDGTTAFLREHFPMAVARIDAYRDKCFMYVKRNLSDQDVALIKSRKIEDVYLLKEPGRVYPVEASRNIVGTVSSDNEGLFGIEKLYDKSLRGEPSCMRLERDGRGSICFNREVVTVGKPGRPMRLTIDADIQYGVYDLLKETVTENQAVEGGVVVVDPTNGDVIALVQCPSCDPDEKSFDAQHTKNICVSDAYEFGSVIKPFCALAALEEGIVDEHTIIDCRGVLETYLYRTRISTVTALGKATLRDVVGFSNNIGMAQLGYPLGKKLFEHYTNRIGFGHKTGLEVVGEQSGYITPLSRWSRPTPISLSFGYEVRVTPVQLARAYCLFARDGRPVQLHLVAHDGKESHELSKSLYSKKSIDLMRDFLHYVVEEGGATRARLKGYTVIGKTGTANMAVPGGYDKTRLIVSFAGIIEKGSYQRVVVVFVREAKGKNVFGSTIAGPLFRRIVQLLVTHDRVVAGAAN